MRIFVIILLLVLSISLQVFAEISDTTNLLTIQELASLKAEEGIHFSLSEGNEYLLIESSGAPERTPSIYFGTIKVTPGNTYTYVVSSDSEMHCSAMLYVTSSHGNLVWPGSEIKDGLAINTFSIPQGTTEITLGIAFLYPIAGDAFQVKDVGLFAGIIDSFPQLEVKRKNVFFSLKNESPQPYGKNLFVIESIDSIKTEKSISFLPTDCLIVKSSGAIDQTPALYFGTVNVTPGETYSYIVKGNASKGSNISLYVMSSAGNIVWPGNKIENGFTRNSFMVPPEVNQITLAIAFLYPRGTEYVMIEDVGLFLGDGPLIRWSKNSGIHPIIMLWPSIQRLYECL